MYALSDFSAANYYTTQNLGGEAGVATGFGYVIATRLESLVASFRRLLGRWGASGVGGGGYLAQLDTINRLECYFINAALAALSTQYTVAPSQVGQVLLFTALHTGAGNLLKFYFGPHLFSTNACVGYTPFSSVMTSGAGASGAGPFLGGSLLGTLTFRGTPSDADIAALAMATRTLGDLPDTIAGATVTHHWSAKRALAGVHNPAGRKTYGARGFSTANYLATANLGGIAGIVAGFHVVWYGIVYATTTGALFCRGYFGAGWQILSVGGVVLFSAVDGASVGTNAPARTWSSGDFGIPCVIHGVHDGSKVRLYFNGVEVGTGTNITGFTPMATSTFIGVRSQLDNPASAASAFGAAGGHFVPTAVEIADNALAILASGRIQPIPNKTQHIYDLSADIESNGLAMPSTVLDRIGTDHLTRTGTLEVAVVVATGPVAPTALADNITGAAADVMSKVGTPTVRVIDPSVDGRKTYGVQGFSAAHYLLGSISIGATWWCSFIGTPWSIASSPLYRCLFEAANKFRVFATAGIQLQATVNNSVTAAIPNLTAGNVGQPLILHMRYEAGFLEFYLNGVSTGAPVAVTFTPATVALSFGASNNLTIVAQDWDARGFGFGNASLSLADIQQHTAAIVTAGYRMLAIAGKTDRVHDLTADTIANGGPDNGVPATVLDRIGTDHLARVGTGLTVAQRVERVWSYETSPILYGGNTWTLASYFAAAVNALPGDPAGFTVSILARLVSQSVTSATRGLLGQRANTTHGWSFASVGLNSTVVLGVGNGSTAVNSSSAVMSASDVGKIHLLQGTYDGSAARLRAKRLDVGTAVTLTGGFAAATTGAPMLGRVNHTALLAAEGWEIYGFTYALGVASLAQYQAQWDAVMASERIMPVPGLPGMLFDFDLDARAAGNDVPGTITDRTGNAATFAKVGAPALGLQHARAWAA